MKLGRGDEHVFAPDAVPQIVDILRGRRAGQPLGKPVDLEAVLAKECVDGVLVRSELEHDHRLHRKDMFGTEKDVVFGLLRVDLHEGDMFASNIVKGDHFHVEELDRATDVVPVPGKTALLRGADYLSEPGSSRLGRERRLDDGDGREALAERASEPRQRLNRDMVAFGRKLDELGEDHAAMRTDVNRVSVDGENSSSYLDRADVIQPSAGHLRGVTAAYPQKRSSGGLKWRPDNTLFGLRHKTHARIVVEGGTVIETSSPTLSPTKESVAR